MRYALVLSVVLFAVWMLWSGHTEPFLIAMGLISCGFVLWIVRRMQILDGETVPYRLGLRPFTSYFPWLVKEIVKANVDVCRRVLDPKLPIRPHLLSVRADQPTDLGRVILANSITLTPGTVSIEVHGNQITVHALAFEGTAEELAGDMSARVTAIDRVPDGE